MKKLAIITVILLCCCATLFSVELNQTGHKTYQVVLSGLEAAKLAGKIKAQENEGVSIVIKWVRLDFVNGFAVGVVCQAWQGAPEEDDLVVGVNWHIQPNFFSDVITMPTNSVKKIWLNPNPDSTMNVFVVME